VNFILCMLSTETSWMWFFLAYNQNYLLILKSVSCSKKVGVSQVMMLVLKIVFNSNIHCHFFKASFNQMFEFVIFPLKKIHNFEITFYLHHRLGYKYDFTMSSLICAAKNLIWKKNTTNKDCNLKKKENIRNTLKDPLHLPKTENENLKDSDVITIG